MTHINIVVRDQVLTAAPDKLLVSRSVGEATFGVDFDDSWDGYARTIIFATPHIQKAILYAGGVAEVPWEVLARPTDSLRISAVGIKEGRWRPTAHMRRGLAVALSGAIEGSPSQEHTPRPLGASTGATAAGRPDAGRGPGGFGGGGDTGAGD